MTLHVHHLKGCSPTPLAHYLKALGILRLIAEQDADRDARGWWQDEHFCILSRLSRVEIQQFFLERYEPTPMFNPWGGRSGYYSGSSEATSRNALAVIERSTTDRLSMFRHAISLIRTVIDQLGGEKPVTEESKAELIAQIRLYVRGPAADWLGTVVAALGDFFRAPAILGTGGNEGSGSYTAAFFAAVVECVVRQAWDASIAWSLWADSPLHSVSWDGSFRYPNPRSPNRLKKDTVKQPFRQYLPEGEGSPWDVLLAFEGTIAVQSGVVRRSNTDGNRFLTSPFYFAPFGMGSGSSSEFDEFVLNKGRRNPGRGEQWFPLWSAPSTYAEVQAFLREGWCMVGRRLVTTPLDAARAINSLGATRGISSFLRYGYLQRNNLATHIAVPLGEVRVSENANARLIDQMTEWLDRLQSQARKKSAPARLIQAHRRLADAVFAALTHDYSPERWQAILRAAVMVESLQLAGTAIAAGPIPKLQPEWITGVDDNTPELRLALALGSAAGKYLHGRPMDPVRHHWLPLKGNSRQFNTHDKQLAKDSRVVMTGRDAMADFAAIVQRRLIEAGMKGERRLPLEAAPGCSASLADVTQFLGGAVDLQKLFDLTRAFMALDWGRWRRAHVPQPSKSNDEPEEAWLALRLASLPWPLTLDKDIPAEPRIARRLLVGDSGGAIGTALCRLRSAGIRVPLQSGITDAATARRWAAALVFPIDRGSAQRAATILDPSLKGTVHA